jgi:hypothetical protein
VSKLHGVKPFRVTDDKHRPLKTKLGKPLDRGGYGSLLTAREHADAVNYAMVENIKAEAARKVTKRQRLAAKRAKRAASRQAVGA